MNSTLQKAIRAEYAILRAPLSLLDEHVISRLDETSRVRSTFDRGLESLDHAAARLLAPPTAGPEPLPVDWRGVPYRANDPTIVHAWQR